MTRILKEWIGKTDDTAIPPRVKLRIYDRHHWTCVSCSRRIVGKLLPRTDHIIALINGGANRESNLQLVCHECHEQKNKSDVQLKSYIARGRVKRFKLKNRKRLIP